MPARRGGLTAEQKAEMAEQTAKEQKERLGENYVSPLREPEMPEIDLQAEAARIFDTDLEPPTDEEIESVNAHPTVIGDGFGHLAEIEQPGLHRKLAAIRGSFGFIGKTGTNTGVGGGYKFVEATEVSHRFVKMASELNLTMLPVNQQVDDIRPSVSGRQVVYTIQTTWKITDGDTGESEFIMSFGQGADNGDKALPKAQTNAMKYAILLLLQAAGDDPEKDPNTDRLENTPSGPGINIESSNVPGVQAGGRQGQVTEAQMDAFRKLASQHKLEPAPLCIIIGQAIGRTPALPEGGDIGAEQVAILEFMGSLSFADAGSVIKALMAIETDESASPA